MDVTYEAPTGDDWSPVMNETLEYWKRWMRKTGAGIGFSEGCSPNFVWPEEPNDTNTISDYEEHKLQMDATIPQYQALLAMLRARGIKAGGS